MQQAATAFITASNKRRSRFSFAIHVSDEPNIRNVCGNKSR
jgi:hypothetical protein